MRAPDERGFFRLAKFRFEFFRDIAQRVHRGDDLVALLGRQLDRLNDLARVWQRRFAVTVGKASTEQQARLTEAFRTLLVRTYSNALTQYRDQTIDFKPTRFAAADTRVQVRTEVRQSGAQPIGIDYMLEKSDAGWKVFDVIVAGVSLVTNYRGSFSQEIRTGGVDGLIKSLEAKNRSLEAEQKRS